MIQQTCPRCYNTKEIEGEGNGFPEYKLCPNCVKSIKQNWIKKINEKCFEYGHFTLDDFVVSKENQRGVTICKQFAERKIPRFGLWLYSPNAGNGKTHLSIAILKHWIDTVYDPSLDDNGRTILPFGIVSETELLLRIRASYDGKDENEREILDEYKEVEFLVLDDLGKTKANDLSFLQRTMYTIIDYRYMRHMLTVVSSNMNGAELQQYLGLYTFDRLGGMSEKVTEIYGETHRKKGKE